MIKYLLAIAFLFAAVLPASALSGAEQQQLSQLLQKRAIEVMGAEPRGYKGHQDMKGPERPDGPEKNCKEIGRKHDSETRRTFIRWKCR